MPRPITPRAQISGRGLTGPCGSISRPRTLSDSDSRVTLTLDVARGTGTAHRACTLVGSGPRLILFAVRRLAIGLLAVGLPAVSFLLGARVLFMQKVALVTIQPRQDMRLRETGVLSFSLPKVTVGMACFDRQKPRKRLIFQSLVMANLGRSMPLIFKRLRFQHSSCDPPCLTSQLTDYQCRGHRQKRNKETVQSPSVT